MNEDDDRLSPEELSALRGPESPPASVEEATTMDLMDEQWRVLEPLIGEMPRRGWTWTPLAQQP